MALPPFWSQVALTLKTRGGLEYLSFDNLYNKLRSLEIDVKGGSSYGSKSTTVAPIHSAFIGTASTNTKMVYSDQPSHSSLITYTSAHSGSIMEDVLHSFVVENEPTQQLSYEDFKQVDQLEMEELDIKWQMAGFESDFADHAGNAAGSVYNAAAEFAMMRISPKLFTNEHNCVACNKRKQHKALYKAISAVRTIYEPLKLLHMDLFGPTSIRSIDHKYYSLVVTDDFSRFSWAFFLGTKDETFYILKDFIALIENQLNKKVKAIRCDNGTEFLNAKLIDLCGEKGIKRDYSNPRTPQQNRVAERKNRTLIEAARSMLADSKLPTMFWTEAVSTTCYVLNRVSITNPHDKTPYELLSGKVPNIRHLNPLGVK
nr:putative ribonuclease H-like domain-containing protein [Tanacetum cinerariifolium]